MSVDWLQGSMVLVVAWLVIGGLGLPLPEDVALLATGVLIQRGAIDPAFAMVVVLVSVLAGDAMVFFLARRLGPAAYEHRLVCRFLTPERRNRIEDAYRRYGGRLVVFARFVAGLRAAVFAFAGIHGMSPRRFLLCDGVAAIVSVPVIVVLGYFGSLHLDRVRAGLATTQYIAILTVIVVVVGILVVRYFRHRSARPGGAR